MAPASIYELEGDSGRYELEGNRPSSPSSTAFSDSSLKPRPLNFSRPNFSRPIHSPLPIAELPAWHHRRNSDSSDLAAPPPIVRTYASSVDLEDLHQLDIRDSIDEAIPPPIRTHSNWTDNSYRVPPPPATPAPPARNSARGAPAPWIYKPYVNSVQSSKRDSMASSSAATDETDDTILSDDTTRTDYAAEEDLHVATGPINGSSADPSETHGIVDGVVTRSSSISDFPFDGRLGWNPAPQLSSAEAARQRWTPQHAPSNSSSDIANNAHRNQSIAKDSSTRGDSTASSGQALLPTQTRASTASSSSNSSSGGGGAPPPIPLRIPRIVKRTSVDQRSEHMNPCSGEAMSDGGSVSSGDWVGSEHDTSGLSVEKIHKLKKKGINPALYAEMQSARKGKSRWISPLQGNSFLM